jgi:opacity protein-like surface antigen
VSLTTPRALLASLVAALALPSAAAAQTAQGQPGAGRFEVSFGGGFQGGASLGSGDAALRTRESGDYRLFTTDSRFAGAGILEARAGMAFTSRYGVEVRVAFSGPELRSRVSEDAEGAPAIEVAERVDQYVVDGALVVAIPGLGIGGLVPFVSGGAGYLRQLHEGQTLIEEGVSYRIGGGVRHHLVTRDRGLVKHVGVRVDASLLILTGGIRIEQEARPHAATTAALFVGF